MYIRCQCAIIYCGSKVDSTGSIVDRSDYQNTTFCNDRKNNRHGQKGTNGSHQTELLLVGALLKQRNVVLHSTFLFYLFITTVISLKQDALPCFISSMPAVITSVFLLLFLRPLSIKFNKT
jgi:hypothetical protein